MEWFGRASVEFTHAASPLQLPLKAGAGASPAEGSSNGTAAQATTDLAQICRDSTPACQLNPLLFNGHLQTMWTAVAKRAPAIHYKRRIFNADHALYTGTFAVDFAVPPYADEHLERDAALPPRTSYFADDAAFAGMASDDTRPMLLVLHGLSGGSHEVYLRHCLAPLLDADDLPWEIAVVNARGCAGSSITSGVLFNARATWDVRQVALWARKTFPNRPLFGLGFSLGANILTNYVGEEGAACPLQAAVVVGNPFDLQVSNKFLQHSFMGRHVYETVMGSNMKKLINLHRDAILKHTDLDLDRINKVTTLYEFDREVQCPTWGYPTEEAYYRDASSCDSLLNIRIPFLALQAKDDPIAVEEAIPYGEFRHNPYTVLCTTSLGGHLSWFEPGGGRWHAKPVTQFLHTMAKNVDLAAIPRDLLDVNARQRKGVSFEPLRRRMQINLDKE
ncbi:alpha/beta hydrolase domain containing protein 1,3 [Sporothrix brasiliensis 5110]|uniref:alcohol O-acetyltransferase n=1 Tax=Sporothrix brasiliensis 5110 TaxID=1398154 RepID=A0A0C2EW78_9PEZI|nr:alpha/beta hydrolase domain containing protein 1,3 [Sporothrix brasiliensis 5110]KIH90829.1 alpha/beta hydrolase domain containing protein 1,3 [Sporothrix brasiliensis 5110]